MMRDLKLDRRSAGGEEEDVFERMSHIGILVTDLEAAAADWCKRFGLREVGRESVQEEGIRSVFLSTAETREEATCVELIEPIDKRDMNNVLARRLAENGEGIFHVAFFADDASTAGQRLRAVGVEAIDLPPAGIAEGPRVVVHPRSANGALIELI